jgi:serine/threonine protein kinase
MDLADATLLDLMLLYHDDLHRCIEPEKLCLYMIQVAQALDYLNARRHLVDGRMVGYQHGDIKPNNILLTGDLAQLADYGLATPTSGGNTPCPRQGTIEYAAPEVFQGYLTETSDQFSLAVMYFVLRTGAFPFPPPPDPKNVVMRGYQRPQPDLSLMPNAERAIVQRALSPIPQNRFSNCTEFVYAILTVQDLKFVRGDEKSYVVRVPPSSSEFKMAGIK